MTTPALAQPVLVTGATGFVGARLARRLLQAGLSTRVLCRDPKRLAPDLAAQAQVVTGDLTDAGSLPAAVAGVGTVLHCAANVATWDSRDHYAAVNVAGVGHLMQALARRHAAPPALVHVSTVDVYGYPAQPATEATPLSRNTFAYGLSKAQGEALFVDAATRLGAHWCVLRPCNVMGPGSQFVDRIGHELRHGLMLLVNGGRGDCGYLDVDNLIDVMLWAAQAPAARAQIFNVRDPQAITWARLVGDLKAALQGKGLVLNLPWPVALAAAQVLQAPYRLLGLRQEPLLHPLIVNMFGRPCDHPIDALRAAQAPLGRVPYETSLQAAVDAWLTGTRP